MAIERLPEHLKSRRTAEAIMAPSAILAGGAGAAAAILAGAGFLPVVAVGALAYGALFLDEAIRASAVLGLALILAGVALGSGLMRIGRGSTAPASS